MSALGWRPARVWPAEPDRQLCEARAEIVDLRGQLDTLSRRLRQAQGLAECGLPVPAHQLARVLAGELWETAAIEPETSA